MPQTAPYAIAILGPTGCGKSDVAERIARARHCKILNADAYQMFRGLEIGTNKPTDKSEYLMLDLLEPTEPNTVGKFLRIARQHCLQAAQNSKEIVVCGGTGLYLRALFEDYEISPPPPPGLRARLEGRLREIGAEALLLEEGVNDTDLSDQMLANPAHLIRFIERRKTKSKQHPHPTWNAKRVKFAIEIAKPELDAIIEARTNQMLAADWVDEVSSLLAQGVPADAPCFKAIGYAEIVQVVRGSLPLHDARERIIFRTRQYAKRQKTWLRKEPNCTWIKWSPNADEMAKEILSRLNST